MSKEQISILEMVKQGKVEVEDAVKLLNTIKSNEPESNTPEAKNTRSIGPNKKFLRIRVVEGDDKKVNVNIPLSLAEIGLKMVPEDKLKIQGQAFTVDGIIKMIEEGAEGEIVSIDVNEDGKNTKVNIFID